MGKVLVLCMAMLVSVAMGISQGDLTRQTHGVQRQNIQQGGHGQQGFGLDSQRGESGTRQNLGQGGHGQQGFGLGSQGGQRQNLGQDGHGQRRSRGLTSNIYSTGWAPGSNVGQGSHGPGSNHGYNDQNQHDRRNLMKAGFGGTFCGY